MSSVYNTTRITGLFSGMDTDELIKNLVLNKQTRVNKQAQAITKLSWKKEAYQSIRDKLSAFESKFLSVTGSNTIMNSNNYVCNTVDASDLKGYANVTVGAAAKEGTYNMTIHSLARGANAQSASGVSYNGETLGKASSKLKDLNWGRSLETDADGNFSFAINDVEFTFNKEDTLQSMINTIDQSKAGVTMVYSETSDSFTIETKEMGESPLLTIKNISGNFFGANSASGIATGQLQNGQAAKVTINGSTVTRNTNNFSLDGITYNLKTAMNQDAVKQLATGAEASSNSGVSLGGNGLGSTSTLFAHMNWNLETGQSIQTNADGKTVEFGIRVGDKTEVISIDLDSDTLQDVMDRVNNDYAHLGVTMQYSATDDKITFVTNDTGAGQSLQLYNVGNSNLFNTTSAKGIFDIDNTMNYGQDGIVEIGGKEYTTSNNIVKVNGVEYDLTNMEYESKTFVVERDIDSGIEKIKEFVTAFNEIYKELYNLTRESQYRDYQPLTDDERAELSEEEIAKWEEKAKSGVLRSDNQLTGFLNSIRSTFSTQLGSTGSIFASIGITTGSWSANEAMQLEIDEDMLRSALENDPDKVTAMFMGAAEKDENGNTIAGSAGLGSLMRTMISSFDSELKYDNLQNIDTRLSSMDNRLTELQNSLETAIENWYLKFASMETALSNLESQATWIGNQLSA